MNNKKIKTGGVALFNGILFSSKYRQVVAQNINNKITCRTSEYFNTKKDIVNRIPIIRGILSLKSQIGNATPEFVLSSGEKIDKINKFKMSISYILLIVFLIGIPIFVSCFVEDRYKNIIQCIIIIIEFILYLISIKFTKQLNEIFMYHGAEHKAVNTYEDLGEDGLTIDNIKKSSRFHKRCGGNFVVYFVLLTLLSTFIPISNLLVKYVILMLLAVLNIGIAYEVVNIFSNLPKPLDIINYPATLIQLFTTKEPNEDMIKLARYGILASIREKNGITISEYVKNYIDKNLKKIDYDIQDIYSILEYITNTDRNKLFLEKDSFLIRINQEIEADTLLHKYYDEKYPLQYITHKQYFFNETYYVDENVLIPRADTEILVEKALEYIKKENITNIIDLCTGSGAIGISIAKNSNINCNIDLVDISPEALNIAKRNILLNCVQNNIKPVLSNLLEYKINEIENEDLEDLKVEMIVSNPPYIKSEVIPTLQAEVKKEPILALDGGKDGIDFYIRIFEEAKKVLKNNGLLLLEIGYDQLEKIKEIIKLNKEFKLLESVKDYGGNDRVIVCRFQDK